MILSLKQICIFLILAASFIACTNSDERKTNRQSDSDIDAARNFLRSILDGDYEKAKSYMLIDSTNVQDLLAVQRVNERQPNDEKSQLRAASITIYNTHKINDSVTIITYANSFKNSQDSIRIINTNGTWKVDLKYVFKTGTQNNQE